MIKTLDYQVLQLPKEVVFCRNCVVSNQRPRVEMNKEGVCNACVWAYEKDHVVDWDARQKELAELCDKHRSKDGSFDVVVPGSGGKDSAFVAHQLKTRWGMHPLCVTWAPFEWTPIGWRNLMNFNKAGFANIIGQADGQIHRKLARIAFELKGDAFEPFSYGQKAWSYHIAHKFGVKLIFYGENGDLEYGGSMRYRNSPKESLEDWATHYYKGATVDQLLEYGLSRGMLTKEDTAPSLTQWYKAPSPEIVENMGLEMHWYSYYEKWTPEENFYYCVKHTGFHPNDQGRSESTYTKYASLDDRSDPFHWYLGYMKFGLGRASRDAQQDIRRNHITREEGVALVRRYDHEFPQKNFHWFLDYLGITEEFFWQVMDFYRSKSNVWVKEQGQWRMKYIVN